MNNIFLRTLLCICFISSFQAQEFLKPLGSNLNYYYSGNKGQQQQTNTNVQKARAASLTIPLREDFYYAYKNQYPSPSIWADSLVYINNGNAIAPMSFGVATFDGLDKHGLPYTPNLLNLALTYPADTLTSLPINLRQAGSAVLQPTDNVGISFFYQAGGNGDYPEPNDSLILDFYKPNQNIWVNGLWHKTGPLTINLNDTLFKPGFAWIKDTAYLQDGFRFRFRNYATTAADFDHWNLDYIQLDRNRDSLQDSVFNDITFASMPTPFLKKYSAMPYKQYVAGEMATRVSSRVRYNDLGNKNITYNYFMMRDANNFGDIFNYNDSYNINPFKPGGYLSHQPIANPPVNSSFVPPDRNFDFEVKHIIALSGSAGSNTTQLFRDNDTIVQYQKFRNYYAFDDGSAEKGYYVLGAGGKMAVKIQLNKTDTIVGAQIYFEHVGKYTSTQKFTLSVWADGTNGPGALLFSDTARAVYPKKPYRAIPQYSFTNLPAQRVLSPGIYYIGFQQLVATGISVGYDMNYNFGSSVYFDSGSGWTQSQFSGSLMLRPVFGSFNGTPIGLKETKTELYTVSVFPNPANDFIEINTQGLSRAALQLYSLLGEKVHEQELTEESQQLSCSQLNDGIYLLRIVDNSGVKHQQKIIIRH